MNISDLSSLTPLANHLWQSTILVGMIWLITLGLKRNRAAVRYWLWFAASVKFLLPFSFLVALGSRFSWRTAAPVIKPQWSFVVDNAIQPFAASSAPTQIVSPHASFALAPILIAVWLCGIAVGIVFWLKCWMQMRRVRRNSRPLALGLPISVLSSASQIEPGVLGVFRPVLLLPQGIESRLPPIQMEAIVTHEMAHVRRRDNLTAAIHMLVEIVFWFFPVVWWVRARLIEERERACDEEVLRLGRDAESYAKGIIEVCKSYAQSPVACISGISGSDLKNRIVRIVNHSTGDELSSGRKLLFGAACVVTVVGPLAYGLLYGAGLAAQSSSNNWEAAAGSHMAFEVESIKQNNSGTSPMNNVPRSNFPLDNQDGYNSAGGLLSATNYPVASLIGFAYKMNRSQINSVNSQLPKWATSERFDIEARAAGNPTKDQMRLMMQSLLADRFNLRVHTEKRKGSVLALVPVKRGEPGPQLKPHSNDIPCAELPPPSTPGAPPAQSATLPNGLPAVCGMLSTRVGPKGFFVRARDVTVSEFANDLLGSPINPFDLPVVDDTQMTGRFDVILHWRNDVPFVFNGVTTPPDESVPRLPDALKDQLGIKAESRKANVSTLIIDRIDQPSPN